LSHIQSGAGKESHHDPVILAAYHDFWTTLLAPECALIVQGMRNYIQTLKGMPMEVMGESLKGYLQGVMETLRSHAAWKDRVDVNVRRSLESFIFGHAQPYLDKLEWSGIFQMTESCFAERLGKLEFVKPAHLEIDCLKSLDDVEEILAEPMLALLSVDQYFAPYEKLERVLAVYKGINSALAEAMAKKASGEGSEVKLPSADDVLPTIILTVLRAKPVGILRSLQTIEVFCPQEYLRAEAGYAYTNLFGAVQFIQDLDVENPESLSIDSGEFRKLIEGTKANVQSRLSAITKKAESAVRICEVNVDISAQDVRKARLLGETTDLEWALKKQMKAFSEEKPPQVAAGVPDAVLPLQFSRSYSFLNSKPDDIRISDIPKLLEEYHTLIQAAEVLLGERLQRHSLQKKRKKTERLQQWVEAGLIDAPSENNSTRERALTS
jgi:hypothetical protein